MNEEEVWGWLAQVEPLLTRDLPPNEAAIRLYSNWIVKLVEGHGDPKSQESFAITAEGPTPEEWCQIGFFFKAVKRRGLK